MLKDKCLLFVVLLCVHFAYCKELRGESHDNSEDVFWKGIWDWQPQLEFGSLLPTFSFHHNRPKSSEIDESGEREREPLDPNYKDPKGGKKEPTEHDFGVSAVDVPAGGSRLPSFHSFGSSFPGIFDSWLGSIARQQPWWKGPNVCQEKEEFVDKPDKENKETSDDEDDDGPFGFYGNIKFSTCQQSPTKYQCTTKVSNHGVTRTFVVKYKCCHGYQRSENDAGCTQLDMKPMMETVKDLGSSEFYKLLKTTGLEEKVASDNLTIFAPTDDALAAFTEKMLETNEVELLVAPARRRRDNKDLKNAISSRELVLAHITPGMLDLNEVSNEDLLHSDYQQSPIRINIYPTPSDDVLFTANCVRVTKQNNIATNGVVHVVDKVITPVTQSITDIVASSNKFSILNKILEKADLVKEFDLKGHYTFLAPSDAAFDKLEPSVREKLLKGDACAINILKHHILAHTVCSSAISMNATTHNIEGEVLHLRRNEDNQLVIESDIQVVEPDIIATNGIIHMIDNVILPDSGLDTDELLQKQNLTDFYSLIETAGLKNYIKDLRNVSLFVPTNYAFNQSADKIDAIRNNPEKLKEFIKYHTIDGQLKSCDFNDNQKIETEMAGEKLRVNLYSTLPVFRNVFNRATINCARLVNFDEQACGSVIHQVNKILVPPKSSILELIKSKPEFSVLSEIVSGTKLEETLRDSNQDLTLLAPTNDAFDKLKESDLKTLKEDKDKADEVLRQHVIPDVFCCSGIGYQSFPFTESLRTLSSKTSLRLYNDGEEIRFGPMTVNKCDNVATNGVVHTVNKVMYPFDKPRHSLSDLGFVLFDL